MLSTSASRWLCGRAVSLAGGVEVAVDVPLRYRSRYLSTYVVGSATMHVPSAVGIDVDAYR